MTAKVSFPGCSKVRYTVAHEAHEQLVPRQSAVVVNVVEVEDTLRFLETEVPCAG